MFIHRAPLLNGSQRAFVYFMRVTGNCLRKMNGYLANRLDLMLSIHAGPAETDGGLKGTGWQRRGGVLWMANEGRESNLWEDAFRVFRQHYWSYKKVNTCCCCFPHASPAFKFISHNCLKRICLRSNNGPHQPFINILASFVFPSVPLSPWGRSYPWWRGRCGALGCLHFAADWAAHWRGSCPGRGWFSGPADCPPPGNTLECLQYTHTHAHTAS